MVAWPRGRGRPRPHGPGWRAGGRGRPPLRREESWWREHADEGVRATQFV